MKAHPPFAARREAPKQSRSRKQAGARPVGIALVIVGAMTMAPSTVKAEGAVLVQAGKAKAQIVVADNPSRVANDAATLVQATLRKMTGTELRIVRESAAKTPPAEGQVWISIGQTRFACDHGIVASEMKPEEIRVVVKPSSVILVGNESLNVPAGNATQRGTYYAAVEFLERLGVRWLWPGDTGEVIPKLSTITLGSLDYAFTPKLFQRQLRFIGGDPATAEFKYGVRIEEDGLGPGDWTDKMRLGCSRRVAAGHGFGDWYRLYFKDHPEYFAVGADGKSFGWLNNPNRSKQCLSNPGTLEQVIRNAKAYYATCQNTAAACFSLSPNDNQAGHCMCQNCQRMDALDGPKQSWNFYSKGEGGRLSASAVNHVSLTDRHVKFWNAVAERLEADYPQMMFGAYAYGVYRHPPLQVEAHKNILIGYVGGSYANDALRQACLEQWDAWAQKASQMMFRPNLMKEGYGFPLLWPVRMAEDLKHFAANKLVAVDIPNIHSHWGTQGLNYYVLCKILWDPSLDPRAVIDDYCEKGFGRASAAIRRYFNRLIELTDAVAAYNAKLDKDVQGALAREEATEDERVQRRQASNEKSAWEVVYTQNAMTELEGCLKDARRLAGDDAAVLRRVEFLSSGFDYAKLDLRLKQAHAQYERESAANENRINLLRALVELEEWRKQNARNLAVGVVTGHSWFLLPMREVRFLRRFEPVVLAEKVSDGNHRLTLLAFSQNKRIAQVQLSADGSNWVAPQPYSPQTTWQGRDKVFVRFQLESSEGAEWSSPVETELR